MALRVAFDGREGFVADDMLHLARILGRDLRIDAEMRQKGCQIFSATARPESVRVRSPSLSIRR